MRLFGTKRIHCPAGQWTTIIHTSFAQLPFTWTIRIQTESGAPIGGDYTERKSQWIFPQSPRIGVLQEQLQFTRGYWNTFYRVQINPATDVTVAID
jgi:hypothetical protein